MSDEFIESYLVLARGSASLARWSEFAQTLPRDACALLVPVLEATHETAVELSKSVSIAVFARADHSFREALVAYAVGLAPSRPTRVSRVVLRALVDAYRAQPSPPAASLLRAFVVHRAFREPVVSPHLPDLGAETRGAAVALSQALMAESAVAFVEPLRWVVASAPRIEALHLGNWDGASRPGLLGWEGSFREAIVRTLCLRETRDSLTWLNGAEQPLVALQAALLVARNDPALPAPVRDAASDALLGHVDRCVVLWSEAFAGWSNAFDGRRARAARL